MHYSVIYYYDFMCQGFVFSPWYAVLRSRVWQVRSGPVTYTTNQKVEGERRVYVLVKNAH